MHLFDISGKVAVITGGNRGIGKGLAEGFAKAGASVAIVSRKAGPEVADSIEALGVKCKGYSLDLADFGQYDELVENVLKDFGTVDILVNNAGVQRRHPAEEFPKSDWDLVMDVNCDAVFFMCQAFGRVMLEKGRGKIINMASMLSYQGGFTVPAYAASKSAVLGFTRSLANEWAARGVNVNAIAPGYIDTEMNAALKADKTRNEQILNRIPSGRWGEPDDLVGTALFLASPASDYVNGFTIAVDGGWLGR